MNAVKGMIIVRTGKCTERVHTHAIETTEICGKKPIDVEIIKLKNYRHNTIELNYKIDFFLIVFKKIQSIVFDFSKSFHHSFHSKTMAVQNTEQLKKYVNT